MKEKRASGIILHPTSLPGPDGMGDLGPEIYKWINFLEETGCELWQVLPLGPTGYGDSPYQCFSAFAGNPYLISPALLLEQGLLSRNDLIDRPNFPLEKIDFGSAIQWKLIILERAFKRFCRSSRAKLKAEFVEFQANQANWLDDFSLFMAIKQSLGGGSWEGWSSPLRLREPAALESFRSSHQEEITRIRFQQFLFFQQWQDVHEVCKQKGITIVGDVPIFVAHDSADAWSHSELFFMDRDRKPMFVAGVPPDYFSPSGQLWGNPLYKWAIHKKTGYSWWIERMKSALSLFDIIRLDHFRGFSDYWEIPAGMPTAEKGRWVKGPGADFFKYLFGKMGNLPIIAEDLGEISKDVFELRDLFGLPGMKILQFAFSGDPKDNFLPHNYPVNCVAYSGTHDNDTARGWYETAPEKERDFYRRYFSRPGEDISWDLIRGVWSSVAMMALAPLQDFLNLDSNSRMNFPGKLGGNWDWRLPAGSLNSALSHRIAEINFLYGRLTNKQKQS
jgi:4-alpha-glucanotransferase